ncbi:hypothetical protein BCR32DRAFT_271394 [Anaeromyces robustus]|uniref:G-protein coupled receptors family 3 profile domain-containing protein n=1 Tax=Anaeromyces robustus TaxID=1754192 RepID=A0A1Y1WRR8_9FUNG|nr:hypothetical protein BCR32DRAFT_271394 [Anaeromyces robustus]|eukprot:ORX76241.1 hypothetical protein BCR32DRAFT_271394 [Anaeromyces robustus]
MTDSIYINIFLHFFILYYLKNTVKVNSITINALGYITDVSYQIYTSVVDDFNEYSKKNNLDIHLDLNLLSNANSTSNFHDYGAFVDSLLKKKNKKYDIYFYDNIYTQKFGKYFLDLKKYLPKDLIDIYNQEILDQTCYYKEKLIGLPVTLQYSVIYANHKLLERYDKREPTTWEELIDTSRYILDKERELNNTDLVGYNGLFPDTAVGICSIYEFIYSFRDSVNSPFPDLESQTAVDALEMMKVIKNKISSDTLFSLNDDFTVMTLYNGNGIFIKYFILPDSFINSAYKMMHFDKYASKFQDIIYKYLYGDETAKEVLKKVDDLTRIYYIMMNSENSGVGLIFGIVVLVIAMIIVLSLIFLFRENFNPFFKYLSTDLWFLLAIGLIIILSSVYANFGIITERKCKNMIILISFGLSLNYIPILHRLISNFPGENNFTEWVQRHQYIYILIFLLIEVLLNGLFNISKYEIEYVIISEGQNFQKCKIENLYSIIILGVEIGYKLIMIFILLIFIFTEWNLEKSFYDIRFTVFTLYIDILLLILLILFNVIDINNNVGYFAIRSSVIITLSLSNYVLLYGIRLIIGFLRKKDLKITFINNVNKGFINNESVTSSVIKSSQINESSFVGTGTYDNCSNNYGVAESTNSTRNEHFSTKNSIISKMLDHHYLT